MNTLKDWVSKVLVEKKEEFNNLIISFQNKIDNGEMPKANEIVRDQDSGNKIKRPPNSHIIYTNHLGKGGLLNIIRNFCEEHNINKQYLVPISKKVSKSLWEKLSPTHKKFFEDLAVEVSDEHKRLHPNYKYKPVRKIRTEPMYKRYNLLPPVHRALFNDDEQYEELRSSAVSSPSTSGDSCKDQHYEYGELEIKKTSKPSTVLPLPVHHVENPSTDDDKYFDDLSSLASPADSTLNDSDENQYDVKETSKYSTDMFLASEKVLYGFKL
ncbi:hypothetical protein RclHR1_03050019 [Rhizophagus clarus]|uniref:HMG box domain-containing protein n=1 Tax=Rhizophagus clarus TaxID=94130 RepID=A0A2Z6R6K4_9GLOM|nr:hypothetical protein RclHR1_03050019 [Rhizophagus clarus]